MKWTSTLCSPAVSITVVLALAASGFSVEAHAQPTPVQTTQIIDVDGRSVRVAFGHLASREPEQPVVIFQNGRGATLEDWNRVVAALGGYLPVLLYDRPGIGGSEPPDSAPTPRWIAAHLHALLAAADVPPPYVLVGHSWGGVLIRYYAGAYPDEVAAMVFVDPLEADRTMADELAILDAIGADDAAYEAWADAANREAPPEIGVEARVIDEFLASDVGSRRIPAMLAVPMAVLVAGRYEAWWGDDVPFDAEALFIERTRRRMADYTDELLENADATLTLARHAGHSVQNDDPELVVEAIRRVALAGAVRRLSSRP